MWWEQGRRDGGGLKPERRKQGGGPRPPGAWRGLHGAWWHFELRYAAAEAWVGVGAGQERRRPVLGIF